MKLFLIHILNKKINKVEKFQIYHTNKSTAANYLQKHWMKNCVYDYKIVKIKETSGEDSLNTLFTF